MAAYTDQTPFERTAYAYAHGIDIERIAEVSGHSKSECEGIIRKNYLAGGDAIDAIRKGTK